MKLTWVYVPIRMEPSKAVNGSQGSESRRQMQRCAAAVDHLFCSEAEHTQCPVIPRPVTELGRQGTQHVPRKGQTLATLLSIYIICPCVWFCFSKRQRKRKSMWSFKKKTRRKCLPQGRAQETLWGLRHKLFAMFKIQQISPKNVLKKASPKCTFSTLFCHLHIYFFLAYPGQNVHQIKQTK